jgi:hypothetical protein
VKFAPKLLSFHTLGEICPEWAEKFMDTKKFWQFPKKYFQIEEK